MQKQISDKKQKQGVIPGKERPFSSSKEGERIAQRQQDKGRVFGLEFSIQKKLSSRAAKKRCAVYLASPDFMVFCDVALYFPA